MENDVTKKMPILGYMEDDITKKVPKRGGNRVNEKGALFGR